MASLAIGHPLRDLQAETTGATGNQVATIGTEDGVSRRQRLDLLVLHVQHDLAAIGRSRHEFHGFTDLRNRELRDLVRFDFATFEQGHNFGHDLPM